MGIYAGAVQNLYIAYFNRPADVPGLQYWEGQLETGALTISQVAQSFSVQQEYINTYGAKATADVIEALYEHLFGRSADSSGLKYWSGQIDSNAVTMGVAALAILNGASADSPDGKTIAAKLGFANNFTASLDTPANAAAYSGAYAFDLMRAQLSKVTSSGSVPSLTVTVPVSLSTPDGNVNLAEKNVGVDVTVDLSGVSLAAGYQVELMNGNSSFSIPLIHVVSVAEAAANKLTIHVPGGMDWGADGSKMLGVKVTDVFGIAGNIGGQHAVLVETTLPVLPTASTFITSFYFPNPQSQLVDYDLSQVQFSIGAGRLTGGHALLQEGGVTVATVNNIGATDSVLNFMMDNVNGKLAYTGFFTNHNLNLVIFDAAGNSVSSNLYDFHIPATYRYPAGTPASGFQIMPKGGMVVANTLNNTNTDLVVTANIKGLDVFNKGAELFINGKEVAHKDLILAGDTSITFDLNTLSNADLQNLVPSGGQVEILLHDMNGNAVAGFASTSLSVNYGSTGTGGGSTGTAPADPSVSATIIQNPATPGYRSVEVTIKPGVLTGGHAMLGTLSHVIATDNAIAATDTKLVFSISEQELGWAAMGGGIPLVMYDAAGHAISTNLNNLNLSYTTVGQQPMHAPTNITFTPVGGTVVPGTINATNSSLIVTATITPSEATGGTAALYLGSLLFESKPIAASDTTVVFNIATDSPFALKSLLGNGGAGTITASINLFDGRGDSVSSSDHPTLNVAYVTGESISGALAAPTNLKVTPEGGTVTPDLGNITTFNGTNVAFIASATITAGEAAGGRAELWIGNKLIGTYNSISLTTTSVLFATTTAPLAAYSPYDLQTAVPNGGEAVVKLYDSAGHEVDSIGNPTIVTNYAATHMQLNLQQHHAQSISLLGQAGAASYADAHGWF